MHMFLLKKKKAVFVSPVSGVLVPIEECNDPVFSQKLMGEGVAIYPEANQIFSPCDGEVTLVSDTKHALGLKSKEGIEVLIHIGIDTVKRGGRGFETNVIKGQKVKKGDLLMNFDKEGMKEEGVDLTTFLVYLNLQNNKIEHIQTSGRVLGGKDDVTVLNMD